MCAQQSLKCKLKISRLDFGGLTFSGLEIRNPSAPNPALTATRLAIDLNWASLFSPRATSVAGDDLVMRLDLSGTRPLLGDLDEAVKNFTKSGGEPGPIPQLDFKKIRIIGDTPLGPVEAHGHIAGTGPEAFVVELEATPARMSFMGAALDLKGGELKATIAGKEMSGRAKLDLEKFQVQDTIISDLKLDVSLEQTSGVLKGAGTASLGAVDTKDTKLSGARADASVEAAAVDPAAFDFGAWLANVRRLSLNASAGEGLIGKTGWKNGELTARIEPRASGGSGGDVSFFAEGVRLEQGAAGRVELTGTVDIATAGGKSGVKAQGVAKVLGGSLNAESRKELADIVAGPLEAVLPTFADAARRAMDRGGQAFDVTAPWRATGSSGEEGLGVAVLTGANLQGGSGLVLALQASEGAQDVVAFSTAGGGRWNAAGAMRMSGGGAPDLGVDLARATGDGKVVSVAGAARLNAWRVGGDTLRMEASGLQFDTNADGGSAAGQFTVRLDGGLAGGVWKAARGTGAAKAAWTGETFYADAPNGLVIQWDEGKYGDMMLGAGALHYTPRGRLAERQGEAVVGQGVLAPVKAPVRGDGYSADVALGMTAVNWRAEGGLRIGFDAAPSTVAFKLGERNAPMKIADISGIVDVRRGWRVTGGFTGGDVQADEATLADIKGKFDLGGAGSSLDGSLKQVSMRIFDPKPEESRLYEEAKFEGGATLKDSVADFTGIFTLAKSGIQIANVAGKHDLDDNIGTLTFAPTPIIFTPRTFQPYDLSPLLRGPANVTGRVDLAGGASWSDKGIDANATIDLRRIGFALATTGVFEGVSGKVQVFDLIDMKSMPSQTITIEKVTLGLPIEKGTIKFQLIGYDAIRLESAEWPFVGGFIRIKPTDFKFSENENRVIAQAVDWDLNQIVELFKIPDVKLNGVVSGDVPVVFSTGSAKIDHAELVASQTGGVIQYTGSTGDAAAQSDSNAKMLFDALKDFRYKVLKLGIDGDIAGDILLTMNLRGSNPTVLAGSEFDLNIGVDSPLMNLLGTADQWKNMRSSVGAAPSPD
ncbi:MAG: YdbH domain-containing protein [Hyphomonadaceae bacterium]|nr:YdbH domain-containing protein [Hyphomonadaceae bacterium]